MKIKLIATIVVTIFLASAVITVNILRKKNIELKADNTRLHQNQSLLMSDNIVIKNLRLKEIEISDQLRHERDSIAEALKIKPKQVEKIIYTTITEIDSIPYPVSVSQFANNEWMIADTGKCFVWKGKAILTHDSLNVNRTLFSYHNKTTQTFYRERPHKFWFIHWGKWQNIQKIDAKCGGVELNSFEFE